MKNGRKITMQRNAIFRAVSNYELGNPPFIANSF
jgi:hypothetical protein